MKKLIVLMFLMFLIGLPFVLGDNSNVYTLGNFSLIVPCIDEFDDFCSNTTQCTITILNRNKDVVVSNQNMTRNESFFSYDLNESFFVGDYEMQTFCRDDVGSSGQSFSYFSIEADADWGVINFGVCPSDSRGMFFSALFGLFLIFVTALSFASWKVPIFNWLVAFGWVAYGLLNFPCNAFFGMLMGCVGLGIIGFEIVNAFKGAGGDSYG